MFVIFHPDMTILLAFDNDGVLRDESASYQRCVLETVSFFSDDIPATAEELKDSIKQSNDDWERTHKILQQRGIAVDFDKVKEHFQDLYLGKERDFTGYINDEPWLADNTLLEKLAVNCPLSIVSGVPREEIQYTLRRNHALDYFSLIFGMFDCDGKNDGLEKAISQFKPEQTFFCDDRPSPIKKAKMVGGVYVFGILPPQAADDWKQVLKDAGAGQVFANVNDYCLFLLNKHF